MCNKNHTKWTFLAQDTLDLPNMFIIPTYPKCKNHSYLFTDPKIMKSKPKHF